MKITLKMIKAGLLALLLSTTTLSLAQTTEGTIEKGPLKLGPASDHEAANRITALGTSLVPAYEQANVVLFYKPNAAGTASETGATLVASRTEDFTGITPVPTRTAQAFTHYRWSYMGQTNAGIADGTNFNAELDATDGWLKEYTAPNDNKLPLTALTEGYHYFRVQGYIVPEGTNIDDTCPPQYEETFIVYVLPQLSVTAARADAGTGSLQYCELNAASQTDVVLKADVAYTSYAGTPPLGDFELRYNWYAVKANNDGSFPAEPTLSNIGSLSPLATNSITGATNSLTPTIAEVGKYKFFVEVEYTLKDRTYDGAETADARKRTYALYRGWVGGTNQTTATEVFVTPAPGKPHITIESVTD